MESAEQLVCICQQKFRLFAVDNSVLCLLFSLPQCALEGDSKGTRRGLAVPARKVGQCGATLALWPQ